MSNVKNQHYVPQFYLKRFANDKKQIWAFDKMNSKSFPSGPGNLASENYFYDQKEIDEAFGEKFMEKSLDAIEGKFAPFLTKLLDDILDDKVSSINIETKNQLCEYLSIQILRTKEHRQHMLQLFNVMEEGLIKKSWLTQEQAKNMGFQMDLEKAKLFQIKQLMGDNGLKSALCDSLQKHICLIYKNATDMPFYTSDHPVSKRANIISPVRSFGGWASEGIEIAFPLSPRATLILCDRTYFHQLEHLENQVLELQDTQNVIYYNSLQVNDSYRFIYSSSRDFALAEEMVIAHKDLGNPDRQRTEVG